MSKPPLNLEINGQQMTFERGKTSVHLYAPETDTVYNHIQAEMYGSQIVYLFDAPRVCMYLSGVVLPNTGLNEEEIEQVSNDMENTVGWNAEIIIHDGIDLTPEIQERYIKAASKVLQAAEVYVPESWK